MSPVAEHGVAFRSCYIAVTAMVKKPPQDCVLLSVPRSQVHV